VLDFVETGQTYNATDESLTPAEIDILRFFRSYGVKSNEMLFFNCGMAKSHPPAFKKAMRSIIQPGMCVQERPPKPSRVAARGHPPLFT